jgi:small conductance mechanosensitive channel
MLSLGFKQENIEIGPISIKTSDIENIINKGIKIIIIIIVMYLTIRIGNRLIDRFVRRQIKSNKRFTMDQQKARTIGGILKSVLKYMTYFSGIASIIGSVFSNLSFAVAGLGTVAIGLGSQSLIKDIINGFFILFEDHFGVGDHVSIGGFNGIVEIIGLRTTVIKDFTGDIHLIPNGSIVEVTNHSRGNIRFTVDVYISYEENVDKVIRVIEDVCKKFEENNEEVTEPIVVMGVTALNQSSITIGVSGKSKPLKQWEMERNLRKEIKESLDKNGVRMPYSKSEFLEVKMEGKK